MSNKKKKAMSNLITINAIDRDSSGGEFKTFSTLNAETFRSQLEEWESELIYRKYYLTTQEDVDDYSDEVVGILDEFDVEY